MKKVLLNSCLCLVLFSILFFVSDHLLSFIYYPLLQGGVRLNIFTLTGTFMIRLKISLAVAFVVVHPILLFQIVRYAAQKKGYTFKKELKRWLILANILFFVGIIVSYIGSIAMIRLMSSNNSVIGAETATDIIIRNGLIAGILLEIPVAIIMIVKMKKKNRGV